MFYFSLFTSHFYYYYFTIIPKSKVTTSWNVWFWHQAITGYKFWHKKSVETNADYMILCVYVYD